MFLKNNTMCLILGLCSAIPMAAFAGEVDWIGPAGDGLWTDTANWNGGALPTDIAGFNPGAFMTMISLNAGGIQSINSLEFNASAPTYSITISGLNNGLTLNGVGILNASVNPQNVMVTNQATFTLNNSASLANLNVTTSNGGTLFFKGTSSAGTATFINNGIIDISGITSGSVNLMNYTGAGNINLGANKLTLGNTSTTTTVSGVITGSGGSVTTNPGTAVLPNNVVFSGVNTYTGTTEVSPGSNLNITNTGSVSGPILIDAASGLIPPGILSINGSIGSLLTNNGTTDVFSTLGSTSISNTGTITFESGSSAGSSTIANQSSLTFANNSSAGTAIITDTGTGDILFNAGSTANTATIIHNSSNLVTEDASLTIGSLSSTGGVINIIAGTLSINPLLTSGQTNVIASNIIGAGGLTIQGSGNTNLTSASNSYSGATTVNSGATLSVTGAGSINFTSSLTNNGSAIFNTTTPVNINPINNFGNLFFQGTTSVANSSVINNAVNGTVFFQGSSTIGATTTLVNNGLLDISGMTTGTFNLLGAPSYSGTGNINLGANTLRLGNNATPTTIPGVIFGSGGVTLNPGIVSGLPTNLVTFSGANTYTGTTHLLAGTQLTLTNTGSVAGPTIVDAGSGGISEGILIINGAIGTTLNNSGLTEYNTTAGSTVISNSSTGTLTFNPGSSAGFTTIGNSGIVNFDNNSSAANSAITNGNLGHINFDSGSSAGNSVITNNTGATLDFVSGPITANNATVINNGGNVIVGDGVPITLTIGSLSGNGGTIFVDGILTMNPLQTAGQTNTISSVIANGPPGTSSVIANGPPGTGNLVIQGSGTTVLDAVNTYTGTTTIDSGATLLVGDIAHPGASIASSSLTTINSGGTLGGYGTVGPLINNGTLLPGGGGTSPAGTLHINGTYTQSPAATYFVNIDAAANTNSFAATGTATLNDGNLTVDIHNNPGAINHLYTILTAGSVAGQFTPTPVSPFFIQEVFYNPTNVQYLLTFNSAAITGGATTPNQQAVANNIIATNGTSAIIQALEGLNPENLSLFLAELSAATYANQQVALAQIERQFDNQLANRIDAYQSCITKDIRYYKARKVNSYNCNDQVFWAKLYTGNDDIRSAAGIAGLSTYNWGLAMGAETPMLDGTTVVGAGAGFLDFNGKTKGNETATWDGNLYQFGVYVRQQIANLRFGGSASFALANDLSTDRAIENVSNAGQIISTYNNDIFTAQARASYRFDPYNGYNFQPIAGIVYQRVNAYSVEEFGIPGFDLEITAPHYTSFRSVIGGEVDFLLDIYTLSPYLYLAWEHEFSETNGQFDANFIGVVPQFHIIGDTIGPNFIDLQAGLVHVERYYWELTLSYEGRFGSNFNESFLNVIVGYF